MSPETKKLLIHSGAFVAAVAIAYFLYRRYEANAAASAANAQPGSDQASQDELTLLAELGANASQYAVGGGGGTAFTLPTSATGQQSLADQISSIEQALGFAPTTSGTGSSVTSGSGGTGTGTSGGASKTPPLKTSGPPPRQITANLTPNEVAAQFRSGGAIVPSMTPETAHLGGDASIPMEYDQFL